MADSTAKHRRYLIDHKCTLLGLLPAGSTKAEREDIDGGADMDVWQYRSISEQIVWLENLVSRTFSTSSRKERATVLKEAMLCTLLLLRNSSETGFEVSFKNRKAWRYHRKLILYCRDIAEAKTMSSV